MSEGASATSAPSSPAASSAPASPGAGGKETIAPGKAAAQGGKENSPAPAEGAPSPAAAQALRELAETDLDAVVPLKIDGKLQKVSVREAMKHFGLDKAAYAKMEKAKEIEKQGQQKDYWLNMAINNPKEFYKQANKNTRQMAEQWLAEELEHEALSPAEKESLTLKEKLKQYEAQDKEKKDKELHEKTTKEEQAAGAVLDKEIADAFAKSGLPKNKLYVEQVVAKMFWAEKRGEPLSAEDAVASISEGFSMKVREHAESLDGESLHKLFGDGVLKKLREYEVKRVSQAAPTSNSKAPGQASSSPQRATKPKALTEAQLREWREQREGA